MNSNKLFLIILGFISAFLILPKIKPVAGFLILVTICIGYGITKDIVLAICVGFIIGNIFVSLNVNLNKKPINIEGFKSKKSKKKAKKKKKKEKFSNKNDDVINNAEKFSNDEEEEEYFIDSKGSFMDNYKSLSDSQVKGLNKDTQSLIKTQKQLIETLNNMGPALKDGKEILDTFKNYFGKDDDMAKMLSNFKA
jgi:hypothetical protein